MKNIYTIIFAQNNVTKEENFVIDLSEIRKDEILLEKALDRIVFIPRQDVVDKILKFARNGKYSKGPSGSFFILLKE
jgi:hypothetical protein